jgi:hypothetical protein
MEPALVRPQAQLRMTPLEAMKHSAQFLKPGLTGQQRVEAWRRAWELGRPTGVALQREQAVARLRSPWISLPNR